MKFKFNPKKFKTSAKAVKDTVKKISDPTKLNKFDDFIRMHKATGFDKSTFLKKLQQDVQSDGTGSLVIDALAGVAGKAFGKDKVKNVIYKVQKPFQKADVAVGKALGKGPFKGLFTTKESRKIGEAVIGGGKTVGLNVDVDIPRFTAPFDKAKKMVMPLFASAYLYDKLDKNKNKKELENKANQLMQEKEAAEMQVQEYEEKTAQYKSMIYEAGEALEKSASEIDYLKTELQMAKTAGEQLRLFIIASQRADRSTKLAYDMLEAMMIKKADLDGQIEKIMEMDDSQFESLRKEVDKVGSSADAEAEEGITKLSNILCIDTCNDISPAKTPIDRMREGVNRVNKSLSR